jgi:hypothetical protein
MFRTLPLEIVGEVARHAPISEQLSLSRVSRTCWYAAGPFIWRVVTGVEHIVRILIHGDAPLGSNHTFRCMLEPNLVCVYL